MFELTVKGLNGLRSRLESRAAGAREAMVKAIVLESEIELAEAKRRCPVDTGTLRATGHVVEPDGNSLRVRIAFGGPAAPYAIYVHENLEAYHAPPTQAKFLESVLLESAPHMASRVAARMRSLMEK